MPLQTFTTLYPETGDPELLLLAKMAAAEGRLSLVTGFPIPANGAWLPAANTVEFSANSLAQYRIAPLGVFSWYDGAGGTRMTLNSTGLGIGLTPSEKFEVGLVGAGTPRIRFVPVNDYAVIEYQRLTGLGVYSGARILGGDGLYFYTSNQGAIGSQTFTTRFIIDANGNALVGVASANANGGVLQLKSGITFPATQVAATDVNTLDDYEEGTFTPTIIGETAAGVGVYSRQDGIYTKIGNRVFFSIFIAWSAHTGTGNMLISALPFVSNTASGNFTAVTFGWYDGLALTASYVLGGYIANGRSRIEMTQNPVGGGSAGVVAMDVSAGIMVSGSYIV